MNFLVDSVQVGPERKIERRRSENAGQPPDWASPEVPAVDDVERIAQLRHLLGAIGYPGPGVRTVLGPEVGFAHLRTDLPLYLRRLAAPTPLNVLVKLFALGVEVTEPEARSALKPLGLDGAIALGLIERLPGRVRPLVGISGCDDVWLAHDCLNRDAERLPSDYVLGVNPAALMLANLSARRTVQSALDVGTGCGVQALLAARQSQRVVAVDTNPRALRFTRFNARLNGCSNVESHLGNLFEPIGESQFDLILSNPPYVISPETKYMFRDSGLPNDTICETILRQAHTHLNEGGFACVLCNWALKNGESWADPLRRWIHGNGCDAWLLHSATQDPLTYAAIWTRTRDSRLYAESLDRWANYYAENGIQAIGLGAVILRRRSRGPNWTRAEQLPAAPVASCSDLIQSVFQTEDFLAGLSGAEAIFKQKFRQASSHRVQQTYRNQDGQLALERTDLLWQRGFQFHGEVDALTLELLSRCDGIQTLGAIVAAMEKAHNSPVAHFTAAAESIVRKLLALGLLAPVP